MQKVKSMTPTKKEKAWGLIFFLLVHKNSVVTTKMAVVRTNMFSDCRSWQATLPSFSYILSLLLLSVTITATITEIGKQLIVFSSKVLKLIPLVNVSEFL